MLVGVTLKRFPILHLQEKTELFEASGLGKGLFLVCWLLQLVAGVQEYD